MTIHRLPAPQAQAFVACRKIMNDPQTGEIVIIGPVSHVPITEPAPSFEWRANKKRR
jgi:hypothetical protein